MGSNPLGNTGGGLGRPGAFGQEAFLRPDGVRPARDYDRDGRHVNWLGITLASMFVPFYFFVYGIFAWFNRFSGTRKWQSAAIFIGGGLLLWWGAVAALDSASTDSAASVRHDAPPAAVPQALSVGDTWHAVKNGWDISVDDATTTGAFQGGIIGLPHTARGVYLAVTVKMLNTGNGAHALGANRFKLTNAAGQSYDASGFNRAYGNGSYGEDVSFGTDVNPGEMLQGILFFDVPTDSTGLELHVIGGGAFLLGDVHGGQFTETVAPESGSAESGDCNPAAAACCPYVLSMPAGASTGAIVRCAHWAPDANAVNWLEIVRVLCARKQYEQIPAALARDPVLSTLPCPAGG